MVLPLGQLRPARAAVVHTAVGMRCYVAPMPTGTRGSGAPKRSARDSLCNSPDPARIFHLYDLGHQSVYREIADAIHGDTRLTLHEQLMRFAEVTTSLKAAGRGELRGEPEVKPAWTPPSPEIWELVWHKGRKRTKTEYRMYHSEQPGDDPELIGLRFHIKDLSDPKLIAARQEAEMREAGSRFVNGEHARWGHRVKPCPGCLEP